MNNAVFEALSHPDRQRILQMLKSGGELAAGDIVDWADRPPEARDLSILPHQPVGV
jgi:DNA-binding transcriptional ArsR family regulator